MERLEPEHDGISAVGPDAVTIPDVGRARSPARPDFAAEFLIPESCAMLELMKLAWIVPLAALLLAGCAAAERRPAPGMPVDPALQAQAVRDLLAQAADAAVNRLGRPDGYWLNARARIALPEDLAQLDRQLRRFGMDKLLDEFELGLNRAAEAAMPGVKPVLLDAIRDLPVENAASIVRGDAHAASRYFRAHSRDELAVRVQPLMSRASGRRTSRNSMWMCT
jgi:hypothetical protein